MILDIPCAEITDHWWSFFELWLCWFKARNLETTHFVRTYILYGLPCWICVAKFRNEAKSTEVNRAKARMFLTLCNFVVFHSNGLNPRSWTYSKFFDCLNRSPFHRFIKTPYSYFIVTIFFINYFLPKIPAPIHSF